MNITEINTKNGRKFDNSAIKIDGVKMGVIGRPSYNSSLYTIISTNEEFDKFEGLKFGTKMEAIEFVKTID